jgi:predicted DCC family thiol-disulfide oxidoreductase YuxK
MAGDTRLLLLFDGVCNFCNDSVLWVIDRDPTERFQFASLQSELGQRLVRERGLPTEVSTIVLIEGERHYVRSAAALRVARHLRLPWPLLYALIAVPRALRDAAYDFFAARRYVWFGKSESCRVPTPALRRRFVG